MSRFDPTLDDLRRSPSPKPCVMPAPRAEPRRRGRPLEMTPAELLERIRELSRRDGGLFRTHRSHSGLYARARRLFGSWSSAVVAAGVDYGAMLASARRRSVRTRLMNARNRSLRRV